MSQIMEAWVRVRADVSDFRSELRRGVEPAVKEVERGLGRANREFSRFNGGALIGAAALAKYAAGAGLAAIGSVAFVAGLKSTVAAATEAEAIESQLANVLERQGISFEDNRAAIDRRNAALSQMSGIDDELISQTLTTFIRRTDDLTKSFKLNALAADVARGANIGLDAAAKLVLRASVGQARGLAIVGVEARRGATGVELLEQISRKFAGSAEAYGLTAAGAQERFAVALENTQELVGDALLPSLTRLLNRTADWLNDTENQAKIQAVANEAVDKGTGFVEFLADAYGKAAHAADLLTASTRTNIHLLREHALATDTSADGLITEKERLDDLALAQRRIAEGYLSIEEARRGAIEGRFVGGIPESPGGAGFVGRALTAAEARALALARAGGGGTAAEIAAISAELEADRKALAFAQQKIAAQVGNTRAFFEQSERLELEIRAGQGRLQGIREANAAEAERRRQERLLAIEEAKQAEVDAAQLAVSRAGLTDSLSDDLKAQAALQGVLRAQIAADKTNLDLQGQLVGVQGQIAATRATAEATRREAINALGAALQLPTLGAEGGFLGGLDASGLTREQSLRFQIAEANARNEKQLETVYRAELAAAQGGLQLLRIGKGTQEQILQAKLGIAQTRKRIAGLDKETADAFSVQDLFTSGANQFAALGSNIGGDGTTLSAQEAGGAVVAGAQAGARLPLLGGTTIVQNFIGEQPNPAQALQQAAQAARALR